MGTVGEQELGSMYDYLAKIILLGPSGTGKYVGGRFLMSNRDRPTDELPTDPVSYTASSRMNGVSYRRRPSASSSRARSSK
jgi:hypothetical protein